VFKLLAGGRAIRLACCERWKGRRAKSGHSFWGGRLEQRLTAFSGRFSPAVRHFLRMRGALQPCNREERARTVGSKEKAQGGPRKGRGRGRRASRMQADLRDLAEAAVKIKIATCGASKVAKYDGGGQFGAVMRHFLWAAAGGTKPPRGWWRSKGPFANGVLRALVGRRARSSWPAGSPTCSCGGWISFNRLGSRR
jgi:hypothetical protein